MPYSLGPELIQGPRNDSFLFKERTCAKIISQSLPDLEFLEVKIKTTEKETPNDQHPNRLFKHPNDQQQVFYFTRGDVSILVKSG